jgi:hypothetical protein
VAIISVALMLNPAAANAGGVTYTVEPFDFDGVMGMTMSVTQTELGGTVMSLRQGALPRRRHAQ